MEAIERIRKEYDALREDEKRRYGRLLCETVVASSRFGVPFAVGALLSKSDATAGILLRHIGYLLGVPVARVVDEPKEDIVRRAPLLLLATYKRLFGQKTEQQKQKE